MRFYEFILKESRGIHARKPGDLYINLETKEELTFVEFNWYPEDGEITSTEELQNTVEELQNSLPTDITWTNDPSKKTKSFGIATLEDKNGEFVYWGRYYNNPSNATNSTTANVLSGWAYNTGAGATEHTKFKPTDLITTNRTFNVIDDIIQEVYQNAPDDYKDTLKTALIDLKNGKLPVFPGMKDQEKAIQNYFNEIMQPIALLSGIVSGQADHAKKEMLGDTIDWSDCSVMWPSGNRPLTDSSIIAPNGIHIGISSKGFKGANPSVVSLLQGLENSSKLTDSNIVNEASFTIDVINIIKNNTSMSGPFRLAEYLNLDFYSESLEKEIKQYINTKKADVDGISNEARKLLGDVNKYSSFHSAAKAISKKQTSQFNTGYALLMQVSKLVADAINNNPEFSKGAFLILNHITYIQIYTMLKVVGDDVHITEFNAIYPAKFNGNVKLSHGKVYYATGIKGKYVFKFDIS